MRRIEELIDGENHALPAIRKWMAAAAVPCDLAQFYENLRWPRWREDIAKISGDDCFYFYSFL